MVPSRQRIRQRNGDPVKEHALALAARATNRSDCLNVLREYLQALVLRSLHESEAFTSLTFVGGTALRFLHALPRFSEDLDFSLANSEGYAGKNWMAKIKRDLTLAGFTPEVTWNESKVVHVGWIRLRQLLQEAGLSPLADEKLAIKVEVDTRPPEGGRCERRIVTRHLSFLLQYHDLPSLMAGKLHAVMTRGYAKGRDWYDLVWYLSQRPPVVPNLRLLQNSLDQSGRAASSHAEHWRAATAQRLAAIDVPALRDDVAPFLERPQDASLITSENLLTLLQQ